MHDLVDSHSHLDAAEFDADRTAVVARARACGVRRQIIPAIAAAGWAPLGVLCADTPGLHPAYGLHPMYLDAHVPDDLDALATWAARPDCVAVGECGLDYHVEGLDRASQTRYFIGQLELARSLDRPVILHARKAVDDVIAAIRRVGGLHGVVHSFSGSPEQAARLWDLGFLIGLGGPLTYERAQRLRGIAATMPLEFLLLETDAPDQPLATHRGERNEPAHLVEVLDCIARLRGTDPGEIAAATTRNAERLFAL
ncbi:MAG: TatD family hydrolase [Xanthomonadales bacterium]|nr:TatD family hydrolase [Xanthomonadales bacterium]